MIQYNKYKINKGGKKVSEVILKCTNLHKKFGKKEILKGVSVEVEAGDILGFIGPNGAGKTTTIKLILGLQGITSGSVSINGYDIQKDFTKAIAKVGAIVENPDLYMYLSGYDNLKLIANLYPNIDENRIKEVIHLVGLENRIQDKVSKYSLGMRQRLGVAQAILHKPNLLILDEPTSGLDPVVRNEVLDIFLDFIQDEEHTILLSTHITSDLENIADYIVLIDNGKIILNKSIVDITDNYGIIRCTKEMFDKLKNKAINYRKNKYDYEVLIDNKKEIKKEYKDLNIDKANIDEMMYLLLRGEKE